MARLHVLPPLQSADTPIFQTAEINICPPSTIQNTTRHCNFPFLRDEIDFDDRNRKSKFQLAINVYDARKLEGVGKNPKIRVVLKCGSKVKKTKSIQGSLNPQFNEVNCCTSGNFQGIYILEFRWLRLHS